MSPAVISGIRVGGRRLHLFRVRRPVSPRSLTAGERRVFRRLHAGGRRVEWLVGRAALKAAACHAGLGADTARLAMPHPRLSLTHCDGTAVAAALKPARGGRDHGIGIDYERDRAMPHGMLRFFARPEELALLGPPEAGSMLRLWTIKEALFKACPGNTPLAVGSFTVTHFSGRGTGQAVLDGGSRRFSFSSGRYAGGWLSAALCLES